MNKISGFKGEWRFLSNFYDTPVLFDGLIYPSVENAYQAAKSLDENVRKKFLSISSRDSKSLGKKINIRKDWDNIKLRIMFDLVLDKFTRNDYLSWKLKNTGDLYIEESNWWGDKFWGTCNGFGENNLGKILMEVRDKINIKDEC